MHHHHATPLNAPRMHIRFGLAFGLNAIFTLVKIFLACHSHAVSLLSDALHNLGDVIGLGLAWGAHSLSQRQSSERYTYGYKKVPVLAALVNALLLLLSVGIISYEAALGLLNPQSMNEISVIAIATLGIFINGGSALLFKGENDINIKAAFLHLLLDTLTAIGVVIGALCIYYTGYQWIDATIAFAIAGAIAHNGWKLLRQTTDLVLAAVPSNIDLSSVRRYLMAIPGVSAVHDLHIWSLGTQEIALTAHLVMMSDHLLQESDQQQIREDLMKNFSISHITLQAEQK